MTAQEWLVCEDPRAMYARMPGSLASVSGRKWRLLACAIQIAHLDYPLDDDCGELRDVIDDAITWAESGKRPVRVRSSIYYVLSEQAYRGVNGLIQLPVSLSNIPVVDRKRADLFREVIGNPFRPPGKSVRCEVCNGNGKLKHYLPGAASSGFHPSVDIYCKSCLGEGSINTWKRWLSPTAISIAQQIYATQDYAGMPILADAMEEAGCDTQSILEHLRGSNTHVRGCWALDLILGKE